MLGSQTAVAMGSLARCCCLVLLGPVPHQSSHLQPQVVLLRSPQICSHVRSHQMVCWCPGLPGHQWSTQEAGLVKSIGKKGRIVSEILSGACKSTLPKGR